MLNMLGGVVVNGTRHLVSLTTASDDSSPQLLQLLYSQWLNDPSYSLFLAPAADDQLKTLTPLMQATNRTFFNFLDGDPADFTAAYPFLWTLTNTKDKAAVPVLAAINTRAQQYAADVVAGRVAKPNGYVSSYGVTNACIYCHNDTTQIESCAGVRAWINSTNAQRKIAGAVSPNDLISVEQDVFWPTATSDTNQSLYTLTINQCPDNVDLLIVCGTTTAADVAAVSQALADTQLRPKAAYTTNTLTGFDPTNAAMVAEWSGWMTQGSSGAGKATIPSPIFSTKAQQNNAWKAYFSQSTATSLQQSLYPSGFDIIRSALSVSASLSSSDLRAAFLSLNGTTYVRGVMFNNVTGVNPASVTVPSQIQNGSILVLSSASQIRYPVAWPWSRIMPGDSVTASTSGQMTVLGFVLGVLGAWVAQIILEQAVFVRRRGGLYGLWLLLVAVSLGGSGMWCAMFVYSSTLSVTVPTTGASLSISWSLDVALLAWLPSVLLTWCGLMVMMQDVDVNVDDSKQSKAQTAHSLRRQKQEEARKKAALSHRMHLQHLAAALSRNVVIGGLLVLAALVLTRVTLFNVWDMQAKATVTAAGEAVSIIVCLPLVLVALLCYYHALLLRVVSVFIMALAILFHWLIAANMADYTYTATADQSPSSLYTVLLSSGVVSLVCGIVAAVTCFAFIGLQFSRMQLSRNGLSLLVAKLEALIAKQQQALLVANDETAAAKKQADGLARILEAVNIVRPIATEWAFALASQSTAATLLSVYQAQQAAQPLTTFISPAAGVKQQTDKVALSTSANVRKLEVRAGRAGSIPASTVVNSHSSQSGDSSASMTMQGRPIVDTSNDIDMPPTSDGVSDAATTAAVPSIVSPKSGGWTSESSQTAETAQPYRGSLHSSQSDVVQLISPSARDENNKTVVVVSPASAEASVTSATRSSQVAQSSKVEVVESTNSSERWKEYEQAVLAVLDQQADYAEQQRAITELTHPGATSPTVSKSNSTADDASFPLTLPAIGDLHPPVELAASKRSSTSDAKSKASALASSTWPVPTLSQLLHHPLCVEIVKDELERTHSGENAMFYLHAIRYRTLSHKQLRRRIARALVDTYIVEGAPQQINISTRQRDAILAAVAKKGDEAITASLFREAEREVSLLMDSNLKPFVGSSRHRLAVWCYHAIDISAALECVVSSDRDAAAGGNRLSSLLRDTVSKTQSAGGSKG